MNLHPGTYVFEICFSSIVLVTCSVHSLVKVHMTWLFAPLKEALKA